MKRLTSLIAATAAVMLFNSCTECAGTTTCHVSPAINVSGQFVVHGSGVPVGGVSAHFVRQSGVELAGADSMTTRSDADGFFVLRATTRGRGSISGELHVIPPPPYAPFAIPNVTLRTDVTRGDGMNLGRLVVDPYIFLIGHVRDRKTLTEVAGVQVTMRRIAGGVLDRDVMTFTSDVGGNFSWSPRMLQIGTVDALFEMHAPGYPRTYSVRRLVSPDFHEPEMSFVVLPLGWGLAYSAGTVRRGNYKVVDSVKVEFARVSGIRIKPDKTLLPVDVYGSFPIAVQPLDEGTLIAEIRILPPAPFRPETTRVTLQTSDDDVVQTLGFFRFGAQLFARGTMVFSDTRDPVPEDTRVEIINAAGVALAGPGPAADTGAQVDPHGAFVLQAPTVDSGEVRFDAVVRLPKPFAWDTIPGISVPARYSDSTVALGVLSVRRRLRP